MGWARRIRTGNSGRPRTFVAGIGNIVSGDEDPWKPSRTIGRVSEEPGTTEEIPEAEGEEQAAEEWWQADGMPWKHKPGRADIACMVWIGIQQRLIGPSQTVTAGMRPGGSRRLLAQRGQSRKP